MLIVFRKFVVGVLKGSTGIDIDEWIENMPKASGELIGRAIKGEFDNQKGLTDKGAIEVEKVLSESPELAEHAFAALIATSLNEGSYSILNSYASLMNMVLASVNRSGRPVVTKGFLHSTECLTYWTSGNSSYLDKAVQVANGRIFLPTQVSIYLLEQDVSEFASLNLAIRKHGSLPRESFEPGNRIERISEFEIEVGIFDQSAIDIPFGAPGAAGMMSSLFVALEHQLTPETAMRDTMTAITLSISEKVRPTDP